MPGYVTHARWGRTAGTIVAALATAVTFLLTEMWLLSIVAGIATGAFTFLGALFPDVDHPDSIPRRYMVLVLRVIVVIVAIEAYRQWPEYTEGYIVAAVVVCLLMSMLIDALTRKHRGWTHSVGVMFLLCGTLVGALYLLVGVVALVFSGFYVGVLTHLRLDGELAVRRRH